LSDYTSGVINFSGLGSSTDTASIIEKMIELERYQIDRMEVLRADWELKIESIQGLNTRVHSLYDYTFNFNEDFAFYARTSSSSNSSVVTVTNTPHALPGAHSLEVASSVRHRYASVGFSAVSTVVGGSANEELTIMVGSTAIVLSYGNNYAAGEWDVNATLSQLASAIEAKDDAGSDLIDVAIIDDGSDARSQRLVLTAKNGGSDYQISVASDPTNLGLDGTTYYLDSDLFTSTTDVIHEHYYHWDSDELSGAGAVVYDPTSGDDSDVTICFSMVNELISITVASMATLSDVASDLSNALAAASYSGTVSIVSGPTSGVVLRITPADPDWTIENMADDTDAANTDPALSQGLNLDGNTADFGLSIAYIGFSIATERVSLALADGITLASAAVDLNSALNAAAHSGTASIVDVSGGKVIRIRFNDETWAVTNPLDTTSTGNNTAGLDFDQNPSFTETMDASVELESGWTGTAGIYRTGMYQGHTNKRFTFTVAVGGEVSAVNDTTMTRINWSDNEGHNGYILVSSADTYEIYQGVELFVSTGTLTTNETFALDVFNPTLQEGQDTGLAQADQVTHDGFVDEDTTAVTTVSGVFSYRYAGIQYSVDVAADSTLNDLVNTINSDPSNPGVTASVFDDGQGLATSFHLRLTGNKTGAAYQISDITLTNITTLSNDFTTTQHAQNAMIKVDGYPSDPVEYIQRSSNQISDIIEGITLKLHSAGNAVITVENDIATIATRIEDMVNSVNFVLEYIREETKYDESTGEYGIMIGNYVFNLVQERIKSIMTSPVPDLDPEIDTYTMLAQIGIHTDPDNDGLFTIDVETLDQALNNNLDAVARLFIRDDDLSTDGVAELMREETYNLSESADGPMNVLIDNYNGIIDGIDEKIENEEARILLVQARLEEKFVRLESALGVLSEQQDMLKLQIASLPKAGTS